MLLSQVVFFSVLLFQSPFSAYLKCSQSFGSQYIQILKETPQFFEGLVNFRINSLEKSISVILHYESCINSVIKCQEFGFDVVHGTSHWCTARGGIY